MPTKIKRDRSDPAAVGSCRKRHVLLAMGYYTHARHAGIARYAHEARWTLDCRLLAFRASQADHLKYLSATRYDGVIAYMAATATPLCELVRSLRVPVVDLGMDFPAEQWARVLPDNEAIGRMGAEDLLGRGFRNFLFYTHSYDTWATKTRMKGFAETVESAGAAFQSLIWDQRSGAELRQQRLPWLARQLRGMPLPLAVMAVNDHVAAEVVEACGLAGLKVPDQVAVLGVDNDELVVETAEVPISSVDSNRERVGYEAAALLDRLIDGEPVPTGPVLVAPQRVVTRKSTDILAVSDPDVAAAVNYIYRHFREPITVDDVAEQTMLSRRQLQDRFLAHIGRTIAEEITRQRLNCAKSLLEESDAKACVVARDAGFGSGERMSKVFRRLLGVGPQAYRELQRRHTG